MGSAVSAASVRMNSGARKMKIYLTPTKAKRKRAGVGEKKHTPANRKPRPVIGLEDPDQEEGANVDELVKETVQVVATPKKSNEPRVLNQYRYTSKFPIGTGTSSRVYLCEDMDKSRMVAIKEVSKKLLQKISRNFESSYLKDGFRREIIVLKRLQHPCIGKLYEVIDDPEHNKLYLILEHFGGGDLGDSYSTTATRREDEIKSWCFSVCDALRYCHANNVVHRDLKTENVLKTAENPPRVAIIDFGMSHIWDMDPPLESENDETMAQLLPSKSKGDKLKKAMGTPVYFAPEIVASKYGSRGESKRRKRKSHSFHGAPADMWALGVLIYKMLRGNCPYMNANRIECLRMIANANVDQDGLDFTTNVSRELSSFLRRLLDRNPKTRLTAEEACNDPWFQDCRAGRALPKVERVSTQVSEAELKMAITSLSFGDLAIAKINARRMAIKIRRKAAIAIQKHARAKLVRMDAQRRLAAAVKIQSLLRMKLAKKRMAIQREKVKLGMAHFEEKYGDGPTSGTIARSQSMSVLAPKQKRRSHAHENFERGMSFGDGFLPNLPRLEEESQATILRLMKGPTPTSNWLVKGRILVGSAPGTHCLKDPESPCDGFQAYSKKRALKELQVFKESGVTRFVSMQQKNESLKFKPMYQTLFKKVWSSDSAPSFQRHPVLDGSILKDKELLDLVVDLYEKFLEKETIYIHCYGGHGRAGTVAACLLAKVYSLSGEHAMAHVKAYHDTRMNNEDSDSPASEVQKIQVRRVVEMLFG
eukprot:g3306.t1